MIYTLVEFIACFIETFCCSMFCGFFQNKKHHKLSKIILFSCINAVLITKMNSWQLFSYITILTGFIFLIFIQKLLYSGSFIVITNLVLIFYNVISGLDFFIIKVISILFRTDPVFLLYESSKIRILCIILSKLFLIVFVILTGFFHTSRRSIPAKPLSMIGIMSFFTLSLNFILIKVNTADMNTSIKVLSTGYFVITTIMNICFFYLLLALTDNFQQKQMLNLLELQNQLIVKSQQESEQIFLLWRNSIHDYKNHMIALKGLIDENKTDEIKSFLKQEFDFMSLKLFYIKSGNSVVDAILNIKQKIAEENGITFTTDARIQENCSVSNFDLASVLGNLLDNALEAVYHSQNSYIHVTIKEEAQLIIIRVVNSYQNPSCLELKTTKDEIFHGLGLKNVKNIAKKHHGSFEIRQSEDEFSATVIFPLEF